MDNEDQTMVAPAETYVRTSANKEQAQYKLNRVTAYNVYDRHEQRLPVQTIDPPKMGKKGG
jgi:hypothetical protein